MLGNNNLGDDVEMVLLAVECLQRMVDLLGPSFAEEVKNEMTKAVRLSAKADEAEAL